MAVNGRMWQKTLKVYDTVTEVFVPRIRLNVARPFRINANFHRIAAFVQVPHTCI